jgi:hypothetical protein
MRAAAVILAALVAAPAAVSAQASPGVEGTFVIRGATVWTGTGRTLTNTNVVISGGRIAEIGQHATAQGATEIDANGRFVYPGMIDAYTPLGLAEIGGIAQMNLRSELGEYNPHMRAIVALNVDSDMMAITRANGVTTAITAPSGGVISGQAALVNLAGWTWEDMSVQPAAAYVLNYPRQPSFGFGFGGRSSRPSSASSTACCTSTFLPSFSICLFRLAWSHSASRPSASMLNSSTVSAACGSDRGARAVAVAASSCRRSTTGCSAA